MSNVAPAVGHAELSLPPVDNCFVKDMLWTPAVPQDKRPNDDREIPVPRWRLAREGPFLTERSPESIRSMGAGCAFRHTTYRTRVSGGLWPTPAPPAVHRMDWGPPVGWTSQNLWCPVGRQTLTGPGCCGDRSFAMRCWADADERGCPGSICAIAPEDGVQDDITLSGLPWVSGGRCGGGCPRPSGPPRRGTDGSNGAVASVVGFAAAPLE